MTGPSTSTRLGLPAPREAGRPWPAAVRSQAYWLLLAGVVGLAAALRVAHVGAQSLWIDELEEGHTARAALPQLLQYVRQDAGGTPLDYLGVKLTTTLFGAGTVGTRLWALVLGCAAVALITAVAAVWFRRPAAGLVAAFLLALSGFHLYYSIEARPYALSVAAALLQLLLFGRAVDRGRWRDWILFGAATGLVLYAHYFLAMLLVPEAVGLVVAHLWRQESGGRERALGAASQLLRFGVAAAIALAIFVPWIRFASLAQLHDLGWGVLPTLDPRRAYAILGTLLGLAPLGLAAGPDVGLHSLDLRQTLIVWAVLLMAAAGVFWELAGRRPLVIVLALVPLVAIPAAWTADQREHYFWSERQVIFVLPCLYLLAAAGAAGTWRWLLGLLGRPARGRPAAAVAAAGPVVGMALWAALSWHAIHSVFLNTWLAKEDWRPASAFAAQRARPDSLVYSFLPDMFAYGVAYYEPQLEPRGRYLAMDAGSAPRAVAGLDLHRDDLVVTLVPYAGDGSDADRLLTGQGFAHRDFPGQIRVYYTP